MTPIKLPQKYTHTPFISFHCLFLLFFGFSCISMSIYLRMHYNYSWYTTLPISIMGVYSLFPVIHDGSHGTVSSNFALNYCMAFFAGIPFFFAPYPTWRFIHLRHHQFTNIEDKDPDFYSGGNLSSKWLLPLRWITHIIHYYKYFFITIFNVLHSKYKRKMEGNTCNLDSLYDLTNDQIIQNNTKVLVISFISIAINIAIAVYSALCGTFTTLFVLWIAPSALTIMLLIFLFDYLPHRYFKHNINTNKYRTTNMTHGVCSKKGKVNTCVALVTCNQLTYHNIHHLWPRIPFQKYHLVWNEYSDELIKLDTPVQSIF